MVTHWNLTNTRVDREYHTMLTQYFAMAFVSEGG